MTEKKNVECPACSGAGVIPGTCVCNNEWRGNQAGDEWDECRCVKDVKCPDCKGTGYIQN